MGKLGCAKRGSLCQDIFCFEFAGSRLAKFQNSCPKTELKRGNMYEGIYSGHERLRIISTGKK
jgi:hypothetical protein